MLAPIDRRLSNSLLMSSCFPSTMLPHAKASMGDPPASCAPPSCSFNPLQLSAAARSCKQSKGMKSEVAILLLGSSKEHPKFPYQHTLPT